MSVSFAIRFSRMLWLPGLLLFSSLYAAPAPATPPAGPALFEEIAPAVCGLSFEHRLVKDHPLAYLYHSGYACGGVCIGDVNGDARPDVFLVSGPDENALFLNKGGLQFEKAADPALAGGDNWSVSAALADVDGDGDLDLFVCNYDAPNQLFLNDSHGQFKEAGFAAGLEVIAPSLAPYFADFDGDGDLDLFLVTNRLYSPTGYPRDRAWERTPDGKAQMKDRYAPYFRIVYPPWGRADADPFIQEYGHPDRLFRNDGPGPGGLPQFREVTEGSGLDNVDGHGLSALVLDANHDGRPDIYVCNDYIDPDRLWINQGADADGRIRFKDETAARLPYTSWFSMGSDVADVNNDGRLDFFVADMAATTHFKAKTSMGEMLGLRKWVLENGWPRQAMRNCLFLDTGTGHWQESAFLSGVARSDWTWSVKFADYDLDSRVDLVLTNGIARTFSDSDIVATDAMRTGRTEWEIYKDMPEMREKNLAYRNNGQLQFQDVSAAWGLDKDGMSYGAASGDLDADGDLDLVVCNLTENVSLYRNQAADRRGGHWLSIRLQGANQRTAFGAVVTLKTSGGVQTRLLNPNTGFLSGNDPVLHFGLGADTTINEIRVRWPSGKVTALIGQKADQLLTIKEDAAKSAPAAPAEPSPLFTEKSADLGLVWKHEDKPFDDYKREFLLPGKLSQFGPGLAVADVNGDGADDLFLCGAAGQPDALFVTGADGKFTKVPGGPWEANAAAEDVAALFFDADRDGDSDLYVVTGSNEWPAGDPLFADHFYLNVTTAGDPPAFREAPAGTMPDLRLAGSVVVACDFDRDGDLDLFVGSRSMPGSYPLTPDSVLLRNGSTRAGEATFTDITAAAAPGLKTAGLVTAAIWSDVDSDGWPDLLVACEWGPVHLFLNHKGTLKDATAAAGLAPLAGWWNAITAADFDRDGDIDFAILNAGLNTKYGNPSVEKPLLLYHGDMDQNGHADLVEAKLGTDGVLPVRGRSCSGIAMPFIKDKFKTFKSFAASTLEQIYTPADLAAAQKVTATILESGLLINDSTPGAPRFTFRPLPPEAQLSPGYGAVAADFDADGWTDLCFTQNLYAREPETGLWRGSTGCLLRGGAKGFTPVLPGAAGFVVPGDGKALALLDLNRDGSPDLVALQNNDRLLAFITTSSATTARRVALRLTGPPGNPAATGTRITLCDGPRPVFACEAAAGSGCQSQSSPILYLTIPPGLKKPSLRLRAPDGHQSEAPVPPPSIIPFELKWPR